MVMIVVVLVGLVGLVLVGLVGLVVGTTVVAPEDQWDFFFPFSVLRYMILLCGWEVAPKYKRAVGFPSWRRSCRTFPPACTRDV